MVEGTVGPVGARHWWELVAVGQTDGKRQTPIIDDDQG